MDNWKERELVIEEHLLAVLEEVRKLYPSGYVALEVVLNSHTDIRTGGVMEPEFEKKIYIAPKMMEDPIEIERRGKHGFKSMVHQLHQQ